MNSTPEPVTFPLHRKWIPINNSHIDSETFADAIPVKVMSYNLLAQTLMNRREKFKYLSKKGASWKFRSKNLMAEISSIPCDVICLQECDNYSEFWKNELSKHGYESIFTQQGKEGVNKNELMPYGVCIAWNSSKFKLRQQRIVNLHDLVDAQNVTPEAPPTFIEELEIQIQHNIVQMIALEAVHDSRYCIMVTNTHLWWRWDHTYTRCRQVVMLLEQVVKMNKDLYNGACPVVSCGDFNSQAQNPLYSFMTHENRIPNLVQRENVSLPEDEYVQRSAQVTELMLREKFAIPDLVMRNHHEKIKQVMSECGYATEHEFMQHFLEKRISHLKALMKQSTIELPLLHSCYKDYTTLLGIQPKIKARVDNESTYWQDTDLQSLHGGEFEPHFTNFVDGFCETLDYIFLYKNKEGVLSNQLESGIVPCYILEIPEKSLLATHTALPNEQFSSDHLSLVCQMALAPISN
jgi:mRNA deadenylase 3'-5' endonuclease subunit Ccr4